MKLLLIFLIFIPLISKAQLQGDVGAYSNFIWRGTTFSENRPALQVELDAELPYDLFAGIFVTNAEFKDDARGENTSVSSEMDLLIGKRWQGSNWQLQTYYSRYYFPGAGVFDTDEWNFQFKFHRTMLELSYMDDYFGYQSLYHYVRLGQEWIYKTSLEGAIFVGFNMFQRPRGNQIQSCQDATCSTLAQGLNGAGSNDYFDVFFINRKILENNSTINLAANWTNRYEYEVENNDTTKKRAKDFAIIFSYTMPFTL